MVDIGFDHLCQDRGLRTIQIVYPGAVGDKTELLDKIKKVLNYVSTLDVSIPGKGDLSVIRSIIHTHREISVKLPPVRTRPSKIQNESQ